eukprot:TRINITY_DN5352_c0_g1_i1.p1 TRINITY_DN5352_c0_g1~~TRINITY_DN5352_c0_g1_i1.p1  ORF type:complete len:286 (-),score=50.19 TRINITY_DN5352_c0_g1_i1:115-972(-)
MNQQKHKKAYDAYQQAVYRDGRNPTFWCSIGVLYYQINQYRDALDAYSRAIRLNPSLSEVWYDLGTLYETCNQLSDSIDAYQRAADLEPSNKQILQRLALVRAKYINSQRNIGDNKTDSTLNKEEKENRLDNICEFERKNSPQGVNGLMLNGPINGLKFRELNNERGPSPIHNILNSVKSLTNSHNIMSITSQIHQEGDPSSPPRNLVPLRMMMSKNLHDSGDKIGKVIGEKEREEKELKRECSEKSEKNPCGEIKNILRDSSDEREETKELEVIEERESPTTNR